MTSRVLPFNVGSDIQDVVSDPVRHLVFFSVRNEVAVLSADSYLLEKELFVGTNPEGLALSADDQKLYVALSTGGSIAVVDLNTLEWTTIEVATQLGSSHVNDVLEVRPGVVLVSGNYLATVDTQNGNQISIVAGGLAAGSEVWFRKSFDNHYVYATNSVTYQLYQLDNSSPDLPVITDAGTIAPIGTGAQFALNKPGNWLIQGGGVIYDTSSFTMLRNGFAGGVIGDEPDGSAILQQAGSLNWSLLDGSTLQETARYLTDCPMVSINGIAPVGLRGEWLINLADGDLCAISTSTPATQPGTDGVRALTAWPTATPVPTVETLLSSNPADMAFDAAHDLFYVSLPVQKQIVLVAAKEGGIVATIGVPGQAGSVVLSADGTHLYVGMRDSGTLAVIDLSSRQVVQTIDLSTLIGKPIVGAIFEQAPGRLIVGARQDDASDTTYTYLVQVDLSDPSSALRIGNPQGYFGPSLVASPDGHSLYIDHSCCANAIEKRDLTTPDLALLMTTPAILAKEDISLYHAVVSSDGSRLYAQGFDGGVHYIDTATLATVGDVDDGAPFLSVDGTHLMVISDDVMSTVDVASYQRVGLVQGNCQTLSDYGTPAFAMWPDRSRYAILSAGDLYTPGSVCVMSSVP